MQSQHNSGTRRRRSRLVAILAMGIVMLFAVPAVAKSWGPYSSTYNGNEVVRFSGDAYFSGWTGHNDFTLVDSYYNDGNSVYAKTNFVDGWYPYAPHVKTTDEIEDTSQFFEQSQAGQGSTGRINTIACAQMGWPVPDSCTDWERVDP